MRNAFAGTILSLLFCVLLSTGVFANYKVMSESYDNYQQIEIYAQKDAAVICNGKPLDILTIFTKELNNEFNDDVYVSFRDGFEIVGATYRTENNRYTIATREGVEYKIYQLGRDIFTAGKHFELNVPCYNINGRDYMPFILMLEVFGYKHRVDESNPAHHLFEVGGELSYELFENDVLVINGKGTMPSFADIETPWDGYADSVKHIVIDEGVTSLGDNAFTNCNNLESIRLPKSITEISSNALSDNDFTVYGFEGSYAETYSHYKEYDFVNVLDTHRYTAGDVDANGSIDVEDAILLLQYSMFNDAYKENVKFIGSVDFSYDNDINIEDAILLLQHSLFPEAYPLYR